MDPALVICGQPVHKLIGGLRLGRRHCDVSAVLEIASHVLTAARVALDSRGVLSSQIDIVISTTESCSRWAVSTDMIGAWLQIIG